MRTIRPFVHLHVHSEYSLREGAIRIRDGIARAAALGMPALAITDTNALYGAVSFYRSAKAAGVKPIVGVQLAVCRDADLERADLRTGGVAHDTAVLLAEDFAGYQNIVRLVSIANGRSRLPAVSFSELAERSRGVLALVGGGESAAVRNFAAGRSEEAAAWLGDWLEHWPSVQLFLDLQDHGLPDERKALPGLLSWARQHSIPPVATNDAHYLHREEAPVQRVLAQLENAHAAGLSGDRYDLCDAAEMERRFAHLQEALDNTVRIAERCNLVLPEGQVLQPKYPTPSGEPADVVLRRAAEAGLRQRYGRVDSALQNRLDYELSVIEQMGFADYFLVVADFIRFAHKNGISTGPGRGSAAGSLVAYALRITDVDPIKNKLLFERFLNPERVSWPDIDTDFEYERRNEVIQYVVNRYGADKVAQIGTFGTLAAKAAIRDAGRVLQADPKLVDRLARLIPSFPGVKLEHAYAEVAAIRELLGAQPQAARVWDAAAKIEGLPRHTSVHAAGVVISPIPLTDLVPVQPGADGVPVTQYAMEDVEHLGLMKMDFLGLRTLTLIDRTTASVERRTGVHVDWRRIPDDDATTFAMLSRGETEGCFQLESAGMRRVLRDLKPTQLEDLVAVISLYRPGPMENIPAFIAGKHGRVEVRYPHPDLEPILKDTYGVIVYQEQIMQIASSMAGFTLGQADLLRRAVGKKKREILDAERSRFVEGCVARGYSADDANDVYDLIVRFADYGFNRSHAAAYAVLAYRTAYLRANHFPDFVASLMSDVIGNADKIDLYTRDAKKRGVRVLPPCVQRSEALFTVEDDQSVRTGLLAVKNVGRAAVEAILRARSEGPFKSLVDFVRRVNPRECNRKAVESLAEAGALDAFLPDDAKGAVVHQIVEEAYRSAEERQTQRGLGLWVDESAPTQNRRRSAGPDQGDLLPVLYIRHHVEAGDPDTLEQIQRALLMHRGDVRVALYDGAKRKVRLLEPGWSVNVTPELIALLEEAVGVGNAKLGRLPAPRDERTARSQGGDRHDETRH